MVVVLLFWGAARGLAIYFLSKSLGLTSIDETDEGYILSRYFKDSFRKFCRRGERHTHTQREARKEGRKEEREKEGEKQATG